MIQCSECEHYHRDPSGRVTFTCDPFARIKEPECLLKWQLLKINQMVEAYQKTLKYYEKLAPMQDKLFQAMERELDDIDDAESWKYTDQEEDEETEDDERSL